MSGLLPVSKPLHTTRGGWDDIYRLYRDTGRLALGIVDFRVVSIIRWDLLQLNPQLGITALPKQTEDAIRDYYRQYLHRASRPLPKRQQWASIGIYGYLPVLKHDADTVAEQIRGMLEGIEHD